MEGGWGVNTVTMKETPVLAHGFSLPMELIRYP
jgi:hypothetical protein